MNRNEQIASLTRVIPSVANRSQGDQGIFDVGIKLSDQRILTLRTELPRTFPRDAPILRILNPEAVHDWLDSSGRVTGLRELYNWHESTSDLGQVVQRALTEFCTRPPRIDPTQAARRANSSWVQPSTGVPSSQTIQLENSNAIQLSVPETFPEVEQLDAKQLQNLLDNEEAFAKFLQSLSVVNNAEQLRDSLINGNQDKATENVTISTAITNQETRIQELHRDVESARQRFQLLLNEQRSLASPLEPRKLAEILEGLARETDDQSEQLISSLIEDSGINESVMARFRALRVLYHVRRGLADRCRAQFNQN